MDTINVYPDYELALISKIRQEFQDNGIILNIQPFDIVVEAEINNNFSNVSFQFGMRQNMRPLETALGDNDGFVMTKMALGIYKENNALTGDYDRGGNSQPFYYPDENVFGVAATAANVSEADALEALYKGTLTARADQKEVLLELPTYRFRKVPRTQAITTTPFTKPSYEGEQFERMFITTLWEGKKTNKWTFNVATGADTVQAGGATDQQNVLQFIFSGYIIRDFCEAVTFQEFRQKMPFITSMMSQALK